MCQVQFHIAATETTPGDPSSWIVKETDSRSRYDRQPSLAPVGESYGAHVLILRLGIGVGVVVLTADRPIVVLVRSGLDFLRRRPRFDGLGHDP